MVGLTETRLSNDWFSFCKVKDRVSGL